MIGQWRAIRRLRHLRQLAGQVTDVLGKLRHTDFLLIRQGYTPLIRIPGGRLKAATARENQIDLTRINNVDATQARRSRPPAAHHARPRWTRTGCLKPATAGCFGFTAATNASANFLTRRTSKPSR